MADAPTEPLSLEAVKRNLRIDSGDDDQLILDLIADAREYVEDKSGLVLLPRMVTESAAALGAWIDLASWPVRDVTAIRYPTRTGMVGLPVTAWQYSVVRRPVRLLPVSYGWGVPPPLAIAGASLPIEIDVAAGYADRTQIPRRATRAMHMLIAHWYENRQTAEVGSRAAAIEVPFGVTDLCRRLKLARI